MLAGRGGPNDSFVCINVVCFALGCFGLGTRLDRSFGGLRPVAWLTGAGDMDLGDGWGVREDRAGSRNIIFFRSGCGGVGGGDGDGGGLKLESESESAATLWLTSSAAAELRPRLRGDDSGLTDWRRDGPARRPPRRGGASSTLRVELRDGGALGGGEIELDTDTEGVDGRLSILKRGLKG